MKILLSITISLVLITAGLEACSSSNDSPATVNLTSNTIALNAQDTTGSVDASLSCQCPCDMNDMMATGDTGVIHFNIGELMGQHETTHHIVATVNPMDADTGVTYTCTFHFTMHDPMVMGGMQDYPATITATYRR